LIFAICAMTRTTRNNSELMLPQFRLGNWSKPGATCRAGSRAAFLAENWVEPLSCRPVRAGLLGSDLDFCAHRAVAAKIKI
jgi:hypothetical protein